MERRILKNGDVLNIRRAEEKDGEKLLAFLNQVGGESDFLTFGKNGCAYSVESEEEYLRAQREQRHNLFLLGFLGEKLIATANLCAQSKERVAHNCEFGLTVLKKYWHVGAGSAMLSELIAFARNDPSLRTLHLGVYARNERAVRLYERFGFESVGRHRNYFCVDGVYDDEILMDLDVSGN